ncbi:MAG: holo-ACP synthase [Christensenellaceae bacterium]|jgi:holo-[acyl-carrier protein] synthase
MIVGTGVDIVEIDRVKRAMENTRFLKKVYTQQECDYILSKSRREQTAAGIFCAKEAAMKCLKKGIGSISFTDIEILHGDTGEPTLHVAGHEDLVFHISISHDGAYAVAYAVVERNI